MQLGNDPRVSFADVKKYLELHLECTISENMKRRLATIIENTLSFDNENLVGIEIYFLNIILSTIQTTSINKDETHENFLKAEKFIQQQADLAGLSFEKTFQELSKIMNYLVSTLYNEYYDKIQAEQKNDPLKTKKV
jgi:hypothetical protein